MPPHDAKSKLLSIVVASTGLIWWWALAHATDGAFNATAVTIAAVALTVHLVAVATAFILMEERALYTVATIAHLASFFLFFRARGIYAVALFLLFIASGVAHGRVRREATNRINIRVPILVREGLPLVLTFLSLVMAAAYFVRIGAAVPTIETLLPRHVFNRILETASPVLRERILPGFNARLTVDEYIELQFERSGVELRRLPAAERNMLLKEARTRLFGDVAVPRSGAELLQDAFYDVVIAKSNSYIDPYRELLPAALAIGFFIFLRTIAFPYGWLITLLTWGIIRLLLSFGFVVRIEEQTTREHVRWSEAPYQ